MLRVKQSEAAAVKAAGWAAARARVRRQVQGEAEGAR